MDGELEGGRMLEHIQYVSWLYGEVRELHAPWGKTFGSHASNSVKEVSCLSLCLSVIIK